MSEPIDTDTVLDALGLSAQQEEQLIALLVETRRQAREEGRQEERKRWRAWYDKMRRDFGADVGETLDHHHPAPDTMT